MTHELSTLDNFFRFEKLLWRVKMLDFGSERPDLGSEGSD